MGQSYHMRTDGNAALSRVLAPASLGRLQTLVGALKHRLRIERVGPHANCKLLSKHPLLRACSHNVAMPLF